MISFLDDMNNEEISKLDKMVVREEMDEEEQMIIRVAIRVRYELELKVQQIYRKFEAERELMTRFTEQAVAAKDESNEKANSVLNEYINQLHAEIETYHKKRRQDKHETAAELKMLVNKIRE